MGCSDGGREALMEAQRFPRDFDGIVAGSPANFWTHLFAGFVWDQQALAGISGGDLSQADLNTLTKSVLAQCVGHDGGLSTDQFLNNPLACRFDPSTLSLSQDKIGAIKKIFSGPPGIFPGYKGGDELVEKAWIPSMRFSTALRNARDWFEAVTLRAHLGGQPIRDTWLSSAVVDGLEFVPLCSEGDIGDEAEAMQNCVRSLSWGVRQNRLRLWSVRREGERVATLQLGRRYGDPLLQVVQLKGPKNATASAPVWWAARKWLHGHDLSVIAPVTFKEALPLDRRGWIELWRPYWIAKQRLPAWLPLAPSAKAISDLKR